MKTERPLPFDCEILDDEPIEVTNPYSGDHCILEPDAVAVYDTIKGAEVIGDWKTMEKGLKWFRKYFPAEYMLLLD